jgi:rare lipoprotein A
MVGLALSASAKDGSPSGTAPPATGTAPPATGTAPPASGTTPPATSAKSKPSEVKHWFQVGVASWYGTKFQGRKTAGGERFDMNQMTCAHRSLPLGTWLRVTNLKNHRTAYVRVNDRGPVLEDRIVDLSFAAAQVLGLDSIGLGQVRLDPVSSSDPDLALALLAQLQMPVGLLPPGR